MAKQIIILDRPDVNRFTVAFWLAVPVARQAFYANATATSAYKQASAGELSTIQSGAVVEQTGDFSYTAVSTLATVQAALVIEFNARQAAISAFNPWNRYGSFYDGTSWTAAGAA